MDRLSGILHLCRKAGKLHLGHKAVVSHMAGKDEYLVLLSVDAGEAIKRKCACPMARTINRSSRQMGEIFGRETLAVLGIQGHSFAAEIENILNGEKLLVE